MKNRIEEIRRRCDAATPGPWAAEPKPAEKGVFIPQAAAKVAANGDWHQAKFNAWFIAHSREDIPFLLGEVERLQQQVNKLQTEKDTLWSWL